MLYRYWFRIDCQILSLRLTVYAVALAQVIPSSSKLFTVPFICPGGRYTYLHIVETGFIHANERSLNNDKIILIVKYVFFLVYEWIPDDCVLIMQKSKSIWEAFTPEHDCVLIEEIIRNKKEASPLGYLQNSLHLLTRLWARERGVWDLIQTNFCFGTMPLAVV